MIIITIIIIIIICIFISDNKAPIPAGNPNNPMEMVPPPMEFGKFSILIIDITH